MALPTPAPGRPVAVTGASAGIGDSLARELARRGHDLVLVARRRDRLEALADELRSELVTVEVLPADLAQPARRRELIAALEDRPLAGLCNNAGIGGFGRFTDGDRAVMHDLVALNVNAMHDLMAAVLPGMVRRGEGAVLNVASILGHGPQPHNAAYAASKAFVLTLSEAVHAELRGSGVSVTIISPGPVRTEIFASSAAEALEDLGPGALWADAPDVAGAAVDAMEEGRRSVVPGVANQLAAVGGRFLPRSVTLPLQARLFEALPGIRDRFGG
jgi:short-subunit dehydrogenase